MIFSGIFNIKWERGPTVRKKTKICLGCLREISLYDSVCPFCGFDPIKVKNPRYLRAGTRLLDRYLVGRELGEGKNIFRHTSHRVIQRPDVRRM